MSRYGSLHDDEDQISDGYALASGGPLRPSESCICSGQAGAFFVRREPEENDENDNMRLEFPRTSLPPALGHSRDSLSVAERSSLRRPSRRERERRRSSTYRELLKLLVSEDMEVKQSRKTLDAALDRLQGESQRAQLAEQRALELAARFKQVNDARIVAQREADRLGQELLLYKNQLDVAQKELLRGEDLVRDLEAQRDDAEAVAARARSTARRLREQQLIFRAREDGRLMGYEEGLRRGYEEAGITPPPRNARLPLGAQMQVGDEDDGGLLTLPSPPTGAIPPVPPSDIDTLEDPGPSRRRTGDYGAGAQGSRFTENMTPATMVSVPLPEQRHSTGPQPWPAPEARTDEDGWPRPTPIRTASPTPHHPNHPVAPDNWVPLKEGDDILLPPPHEMSRPPIPPGQGGSGPREGRQPRQDPYGRAASPRSMTDSLPSTHISDFDIVSAPRRPSGRDRGPVLSAIPEAEFSPPAADSRRPSGMMPSPITFPVPSPRPESGFVGSDAGRRPGSRNSRADDASATGSSRRRHPTVQNEQPEEVRRSIAEWIERQTPPQSVSFSAWPSEACSSLLNLNLLASGFPKPGPALPLPAVRVR